MPSNDKTRRAFIKTAAAGAAGIAISSRASSYANILGANDRVRIGIVGFSDRCRGSLVPAVMAHAKELNFDIVAVSDIWSRRRDEAVAYIGKQRSAKGLADQTIAIGRRYGLRGLRVPREPAAVLADVEPSARRRLDYVIAPWVARLARRARHAGLQAPETVFGLAWSGAMTQSRLTGLLRHLPEGRSEIYLHPATADAFDGHAPGYRYADELAALTAPSAIAAARGPGIMLGGYSEF